TRRDAEFRDFYFDQAGALKRLALLMSGTPAEADDLTHEALLRAYRAWPRIRNDDPGPYVRRALVNLCRNAYRRRVLEMRNHPAPPPDARSAESDVVEAMRIAQALAVLPPIRRAVVVLRFYEGMTEAEIAGVLDRPLNTVKSDMRRALERLRTELSEGATAS
ncbi:MAG: SigE family RNA polymerase sigma factor, partial [Actinomycetota bacterium]